MNGAMRGFTGEGVLSRLRRLGPAAGRASRLAFWVIPAAFYVATACRTPCWLDATMIVSNVVDLELNSWVNTHNLFHLLGHLWLAVLRPANVHFAVVVLSALLGAVTVHFVYLTGLELTSSPLSAGTGALVLMISQSLWWHSTTVEVYTLNTALMAVFLYFVVRFDRTRRPCFLFAAFLFFGLGCSNHMLMGLFVFAFGALLVAVAVQDGRPAVSRLAIAALCFAAGFGLYLFVFARDAAARIGAAPGSRLAALWRGIAATADDATGSYFRKYMFSGGMPADRILFWRLNYLVLHVLNYPSPALPLAWFGIVVFARQRSRRLTFVFFAAGLLAQAAWSANYFIWDMYAFALPVFVLLAVPLTLAVEWLRSGGRVRRAILLACLPAFALPIWVYPRIGAWYRDGGIVRRYFDSYPEVAWTRGTFDAVDFVMRPERRHYDRVDRYAEKLFALLPAGAHFLSADSRADYPLRYYYRDIKHERTDIVYHSLFIPLLTDVEAKRVAKELRRCLASGEPVFTASAEHPEKAVLDQLYLLQDPSATVEAVATLAPEEYLRSFPGVRFEKIVMGPGEDVWIYRMRPAAPAVSQD